jgi:SAM-dependent methyltransferase
MQKELKNIKEDHLERYLWAIRELKKKGVETVIDAAAGVGYGSYMMAEAGFKVHAIDISKEALDWHRKYYSHPLVNFELGDIMTVDLHRADAIVSIETVEHIIDDKGWVSRMKPPIIVCTVPNEEVIPFKKSAFIHHVRHYTPEDFDDLIPGVKQWFTQYEKFGNSKMVPGDDGRTIGVISER